MDDSDGEAPICVRGKPPRVPDDDSDGDEVAAGKGWSGGSNELSDIETEGGSGASGPAGRLPKSGRSEKGTGPVDDASENGSDEETSSSPDSHLHPLAYADCDLDQHPLPPPGTPIHYGYLGTTDELPMITFRKKLIEVRGSLVCMPSCGRPKSQGAATCSYECFHVFCADCGLDSPPRCAREWCKRVIGFANPRNPLCNWCARHDGLPPPGFGHPASYADWVPNSKRILQVPDCVPGKLPRDHFFDDSENERLYYEENMDVCEYCNGFGRAHDDDLDPWFCKRECRISYAIVEKVRLLTCRRGCGQIISRVRGSAVHCGGNQCRRWLRRAGTYLDNVKSWPQLAPLYPELDFDEVESAGDDDEEEV